MDTPGELTPSPFCIQFKCDENEWPVHCMLQVRVWAMKDGGWMRAVFLRAQCWRSGDQAYARVGESPSSPAVAAHDGLCKWAAAFVLYFWRISARQEKASWDDGWWLHACYIQVSEM